MTNSDNLVIAAVKAQVSFRVNGRSVGVDDEKTVVRLFDREIMRLYFNDGVVRLNGETPVSRKSARVMNALLKEFTTYEVLSREGQWMLRDTMSGALMPMAGVAVSVPVRYSTERFNE